MKGRRREALEAELGVVVRCIAPLPRLLLAIVVQVLEWGGASAARAAVPSLAPRAPCEGGRVVRFVATRRTHEARGVGRRGTEAVPRVRARHAHLRRRGGEGGGRKRKRKRKR